VDGHDPVLWFNQEVHPHGGQLKAHLRNSFPSIRDLDDVVQESFLRVWQARTRQPINSAKAFLFRVARNLALNLVRRERRSPLVAEGDAVELGVIDDRQGVAERLSEQEKIDLLAEALATLPAATREILLLHKFDGIPQSEIARRLGLTDKAVEHRVARGIEACTKFFHAHGHDLF